MNVLITGGAGFIGSAVVRYFIKNTEHVVINLDKLTYAGNLDSLSSVADSERYIFENVDICNEQEVARIFMSYKPDKIMH